jgi:ketosteroid isomerase-like protein
VSEVELPRAIRAYFTAAEGDDIEAVVGCFEDDAVVFDEHQTWQGHPDIRRWRETVATKFDYTIEVRNLVSRDGTDDGDRFVVRTHLEGNSQAASSTSISAFSFGATSLVGWRSFRPGPVDTARANSPMLLGVLFKGEIASMAP